jgi:hypothetical protein
MTSYITKRTDQLEIGDVVAFYGLRLLIDNPRETYQPNPASPDRPVYVFRSLVLNPDHDSVGTTIPRSWLYDHARVWGETYDEAGAFTGYGFTIPEGTSPRWSIQGNDLAAWSVETVDETAGAQR